jgi:diaminopropionate ammonia-lyase
MKVLLRERGSCRGCVRLRWTSTRIAAELDVATSTMCLTPRTQEITVAGVAGIAGLVAHPELLQLGVDSPVGFLSRWPWCSSWPAPTVGVVALRQRAPAERPAAFVAVSVLSLVFFLPVVLFESPDAAVAGLTLARGFQYLVIMGLVAAGERCSQGRTRGLTSTIRPDGPVHCSAPTSEWWWPTSWSTPACGDYATSFTGNCSPADCPTSLLHLIAEGAGSCHPPPHPPAEPVVSPSSTRRILGSEPTIAHLGPTLTSMDARFASNPMRVREQRSQTLNFPRAFHVRLPDYSPTPLLDLSDLAVELGIGRLWLKDESRRFQMRSFELLGTAWALYREVLGRLMRRVPWDSIEELLDKIAPVGVLHIVVVSDNEFGVAAARAARLFGFDAVVYVPGEMSVARLDALSDEGAKVVAVPGGYDAALAAAATETGIDTVVLSDTSWAAFTEIPQWVTDGYTTVFEEAADEIDRRQAPALDAVMTPLGTGALAAAAARNFRGLNFPADVGWVGVEPVGAPCFVESALAGRRVAMPQPAPSLMQSLARGLPSPLAWESVAETFDAFVAITDDRAADAVERLDASGVCVSPAGAAALGGLLEVIEFPSADMPLGRDSSVLVVATESARA